MVKYFLTHNPRQTKKLGQDFAKKFLRNLVFKKGALVLALQGELGSGKTTFLQGFARGLRVKGKILSPTFILIKRLKIKDLRFKNFYHIDCYRLKTPKELLDLGFKDIIFNPQNIVAVEWAERIRKILPSNAIRIKFKPAPHLSRNGAGFIDKNTRKIIITIPRGI